jgi:hypothetical protein
MTACFWVWSSAQWDPSLWPRTPRLESYGWLSRLYYDVEKDSFEFPLLGNLQVAATPTVLRRRGTCFGLEGLSKSWICSRVTH